MTRGKGRRGAGTRRKQQAVITAQEDTIEPDLLAVTELCGPTDTAVPAAPVENTQSPAALSLAPGTFDNAVCRLSTQNQPDICQFNTTASLETPGPASEGLKAKRWSLAESAKLVLQLFEERNAGNQADNGWKSPAWTSVSAALRDEGYIRSSKSCKDRWNILKSQFIIVQKLCKMSGFGWDDGRQVVTAAQDVWDKLSKNDADNTYMVWRDTPFPLFDNIANLAGGRHATGDAALSVTAATNPERLHSTLIGDEFPTTFSDVIAYPSTPHTVSLSASSSLQSIGTTMAPGTPSSNKRALAAPQPEDSAKKRRINGPTAVADVADAMRELASSFADGSAVAPSTPSRRGQAVAHAARDVALTRDERKQLIHILRKDITVVDTYNALMEDDELRADVVRDIFNLPEY